MKLQAQFKELSQEAVKLRNRVPRETMRSDRAEDWLEKERAKMEKRVAQAQVRRGIVRGRRWQQLAAAVTSGVLLGCGRRRASAPTTRWERRMLS